MSDTASALIILALLLLVVAVSLFGLTCASIQLGRQIRAVWNLDSESPRKE